MRLSKASPFASLTPVANHLSWSLAIPVTNTLLQGLSGQSKQSASLKPEKRPLYVTAYFAFGNRPRAAEKVSIFVYCDEPENIKSFGNDRTTITRLGPHVKTHERHFLQKAEYTVCASYASDHWLFVPHNKVFQSDFPEFLNQDVLWKFNISASEQKKGSGHARGLQLECLLTTWFGREPYGDASD